MIKVVGTAKYAHKSNLQELMMKCFKRPLDMQMFMQFLKRVDKQGITYDIIKYDKGNVTLISSPDWDTANEPIVGMCYRWKLTDWMTMNWVEPSVTENFKQIYHNKWMFVAPNYTGFDLEKAKQRSEIWNNLPDIKSVKNKIGYKSFWKPYLGKYGISL